jgi:hypothetical protein
VAQVVGAGARVRIDVQERGGLLLQVLDQQQQHDVLDDVGEVSGVKSCR